MVFEIDGIRVEISFYFLAVLTAFLLLDKTGLAGFMFCAALLHELGHLTAMYILKQVPSEISFKPFGIRMANKNATRISYAGEIFIYAAGPAANFICAGVLAALYGQSRPLLCAVHLAIGLFNMLPVSRLDGGQIISLAVTSFAGPHRAYVALKIVSLVVITPMFACGVYMTVQSASNITLAITSAYLLATSLIDR